MSNIYVSIFVCKVLKPIGIPGYNDVILGLEHGNGNSDIMVKGTCSRFEVGKMYVINVAEVL